MTKLRLDILEQAQAIRNAMNGAGSVLTDEQAVENKMLYPIWSGNSIQVYDGTDGEHPQTKMRRSDALYKCIQSHTTQADWTPELTPNLWAVIDETHAGTIDDPIPAERGMEYEYGLYYLDPEDGLTYLCKRGSETGTIVLQYLPHELVGNYFELAEQG